METPICYIKDNCFSYKCSHCTIEIYPEIMQGLKGWNVRTSNDDKKWSKPQFAETLEKAFTMMHNISTLGDNTNGTDGIS